MRTAVRDYRKQAGDLKGCGYVIERLDDGTYSWSFQEPFSYKGSESGVDHCTSTFPDVVAAIRDAADDWEDNGSDEPKFSRTLRAVATRLEKGTS